MLTRAGVLRVFAPSGVKRKPNSAPTIASESSVVRIRGLTVHAVDSTRLAFRFSGPRIANTNAEQRSRCSKPFICVLQLATWRQIVCVMTHKDGLIHPSAVTVRRRGTGVIEFVIAGSVMAGMGVILAAILAFADKK